MEWQLLSKDKKSVIYLSHTILDEIIGLLATGVAIKDVAKIDQRSFIIGCRFVNLINNAASINSVNKVFYGFEECKEESIKSV